jgi:hypothetical protein
MYSRRELHDRYLEKLENYVVACKESQRYSSDRFDILIISLSTTALILSVGFTKNLFPDLANLSTGILKTSWLLYVLSICSNLISQITSYYGVKYDVRCVKSEIEFELGNGHDTEYLKFERLCKRFGACTEVLNFSSLLLFIFATGILMNFLSTNF